MNGTVESLTTDWRGDTLTAAVASGDTVLTVGDTVDFDEDDSTTRWLTIADTTPREYVDVDEDAGTVTLAGTAGTAFDAGDPVTVWDASVLPSGAKVVEYVAAVVTDRGPVDAVVPHEKIPFGGIDTLVGASVTLDEDESGGWFVDQVLGREPSIDSAYVSVPKGRGVRTSADPVSVLHDTNTYIGTVTRDADFSTDDFTLDGSGHLVYSGAPCAVVATAAAAWAGNSTGYRRISILQSTAAASNTVTQVDPDTASVTRLSVTGIFSLVEGESLQVGLRQTSTAALDVTDIEIRAVVVGYL